MIHPDLPLIDLHRHLDGSIRLETIIELGIAHNLPLPAFDVEGLRPQVQVMEPQPGVMAFIAKFRWMVGVLADYDACRRVAYESVVDASGEGLDYIELRFSPVFMAEPFGLDPRGVVEAVVDGIASGSKETGLKTNLIGIISRTYGAEIGSKELDALLAFRDDLVAIDLAGDEANFPAKAFVTHFSKVRDAGLGVTIHAGEAAGAGSVWDAIKLLGATRIGHGVRMDEDSVLKVYLKEHKIGIEANLTSNYQTSTVDSLHEHPLKNWLDEGLMVSINTDDPGISNIDLQWEFEHAAVEAGLDETDTRLAQGNAVSMAFLSEQEKKSLLKKRAAMGRSDLTD